MSALPVILITGASSGIGEATARLFALKGYRVVIAARRSERLDALAEDLRGEGAEVLPVKTDVTDLTQIQRLTNSSLEKFGRIDILFNNAGFGRLKWLEELDPMVDIKAQIDTNLLGMIWMTQAVLPGMIAQRSGHIINMSSMAGYIATPTYTIYAATKFAVRGFTEALRREVHIHGIHVSAIYPGGATSEFNEVAGINRTTNVRTPDFLVLSPQVIAEAVWDLVQRPKRARLMPWLLYLASWGNLVAPGLYDVLIERLFVKPERGLK
jgi:NADP-dependent 3-hydroxy acid dehydrogenase YdfG